MSNTKCTPGPKPLTQKEQRTLSRLQIKWAKKTITTEEKGYALALSHRAWLADHVATTNAKTNAAMTPKERRASENILAAFSITKTPGTAS
jgi:hypothetical protein